MSIVLYPPGPRQDPAFYRYLFDVLRRYGGAHMASAPRPIPRMEKPRQHESIWIVWQDVRILLDMSDHIFLYDLPALKHCDLYLKANLNVSMTEKILARVGMDEEAKKIRPFLFLAPTLSACAHLEKWIHPLRRFDWKPYDFFNVVGVYDNPFLKGVPVEAEQDIAADPETNHFWIRYQIQRALKGTGMRGFCRLTNRCNPVLLDKDGVVHANLDSRLYLLAMAASRITVINTLPHAVFPWKAMETIALGTPFVVERRPQIEMPKDMELLPERHYLELLPELPDLDESAQPDDLCAYRLFPRIALDRLRERAEWLKGEIRDRNRMAEMRAEVDAYRRRVLDPEFMVRFFTEMVRQAGNGKRDTTWGG